ncbi:MAG: hypothetical protein Q9181_007555 [Wetmoreana brouardii]
MRPFHKGRVDIYQSVLQPTKAFCSAAASPDSPYKQKASEADGSSVLRPLFDTAVKAHTNLLARVSQGRGLVATCTLYKKSCSPGEELPPLFDAESAYAKTRPGKLITDCTEWLSKIQDAGFAMPDPEFVWVHYEIDESGCDFAIRAPEGRAADFIEALKMAAGLVKKMLDRS